MNTKTKITPFLIYGIGFIIVIGLSNGIQDEFLAGELIGSYLFYGGAIVTAFYVFKMILLKKINKQKSKIPT